MCAMGGTRLAVLAIGAALLSACVSSNEAIQGPSGATVHDAKCNGSPNACLKKAAATCKGPYQVLDSSSNAGGAIADIMPGPVTWYRMSYQCGLSDGRMPSFPFRGQQYTPPPVVIQQPRVTRTTCGTVGNTLNCTSF